LTQKQPPTEQEIFVLYFQRVPPISPAIRLEEGDTWWGRLHHLPSGQITPLHNMDDLLTAINWYFQTPAQSKELTGLK
jgi:hypothetical protein